MKEKNKKIAIITLYCNDNYGNKLQNYALQTVINGFGFETDTIILKNKESRLKRLFFNFVISKTLFCKIIISRIKRQKNSQKTEDLKIVTDKIENFKKFSKNYLSEVFFEIDLYNFKISKEISNKYLFFVVGSDQVWNPWHKYFISLKKNFLGFAPKEKRISYAASFSVNEIPSTYKSIYKKYLKQIDNLSVREEEGARIIKDLIGKDAYVHLDPTLLLTKDEWLKLASEARYKPNKKYILLYILGELSIEQKEFIEQISIDNDLEIISLADIKDEKRYDADPSEFLDYINSCSLLFTDSFHGTVFSILFNKPFIIIDRVFIGQSMNSRIETLLKMFQLEHRHWNQVFENKDCFNVYYGHIESILEKERKRSLEYLKDKLCDCNV